MAIQKLIEFNKTGAFIEIWRIQSISIYRTKTILLVGGWTSKAAYDDDLDKKNNFCEQYFTIEDIQENPEDEIEEKLAFTEYLSNSALMESGKSPLANSYNYLMTLPEFEGGKQV